MHGEAHGYQVRQDLRMWAAERWANVKPGSIYHALKKMASDGLLQAVHTEESDLGPAALDRGTLTYLLKTRTQLLQAAVDSTELMIANMIAEQDGARGKPPHVKELFTHWLVTSSAEVAWLRDLIARLEAGEYNLAGEHPHAFGTPPLSS